MPLRKSCLIQVRIPDNCEEVDPVEIPCPRCALGSTAVPTLWYASEMLAKNDWIFTPGIFDVELCSRLWIYTCATIALEPVEG